MPIELLIDRFLKIDAISHGGHDTRARGMCVNEAAAWIAGEKHSYNPQCVSPILSSLTIAINDTILNDATRTAVLKPYAAKLVGTRDINDPATVRAAQDNRRAYAIADAYVKRALPEINPDLAEACRTLPHINDWHSRTNAESTIGCVLAASHVGIELANYGVRTGDWETVRAVIDAGIEAGPNQLDQLPEEVLA